MEKQELHAFCNLSLALLGVLITSAYAHVSGIGEIVPGKGAVVVQAASNGEARKLGVKLLQEGATPAQIIEAMRNERFDPENRKR